MRNGESNSQIPAVVGRCTLKSIFKSGNFHPEWDRVFLGRRSLNHIFNFLYFNWLLPIPFQSLHHLFIFFDFARCIPMSSIFFPRWFEWRFGCQFIDGSGGKANRHGKSKEDRQVGIWLPWRHTPRVFYGVIFNWFPEMESSQRISFSINDFLHRISFIVAKGPHSGEGGVLRHIRCILTNGLR